MPFFVFQKKDNFSTQNFTKAQTFKDKNPSLYFLFFKIIIKITKLSIICLINVIKKLQYYFVVI